MAFILYMTEDWEEHFGGSLELFDTDENGQPGKVVHSIVPQWNTFAFFEVRYAVLGLLPQTCYPFSTRPLV